MIKKETNFKKGTEINQSQHKKKTKVYLRIR